MSRIQGSRSRTVRSHPAAVDLAPALMLLAWGIALPVHSQDLLPRLVLVASVMALIRLVAVEMRPTKLRSPRRVLILGSGQMAAKLVEAIHASDASGYVVAGVVDDAPRKAEWTGNARWLGAFEQLFAIVEEVRPSRIIMAVADRRLRLPLEPLIAARVKGIVIEDAADFYERLAGKMAIEAVTPSMLFLSKGFRNRGASEITARAISILGALLGLVLFAPLLLAIAVAVKLDSRGSVLFIQDRAGRGGRPFGLLKFRTMHPGGERRSEWVQDNADRITRVGKWLRRFRLDEVPQLVNVLRGEMNLVGPRPHPTSNQETFERHIAYYGLRSTVHPGVTGWAQVRYGYANNLDEETEKMRYDLYYIKNRSFWLDLRILFNTVAIILRGHGSSAVLSHGPAHEPAGPQ